MTLDKRIVTRRGALALAGALAMVTAAACASEPPKPVDPTGPADPEGATIKTAATDPAASAYQAGATGFALSLLAAAMGSAKGNAVISPLSISQCIALVAQGAGGTTLQQIATAFGCAGPDELRSGANAELTAIAQLAKAKLDMANTAFVDDSFQLRQHYATMVADWFGVAPHTSDFADPAKATTMINSWVAERTNDKILELLEPGQITADTRTVLVNALYLDALWAAPFNPDKSTDLPFTLADGSVITSKFMADDRQVQVAQEDGALFVELPYQDDDLAALFYLPEEGVGLADATAALGPDTLLGLTAKAQKTACKLHIPVFQARQRLEVSDALQNLGIVDAFDGTKADFSALADEPTYISFVQHEAWLKVAEKGTEGAAATAAGNEATSVPADAQLQIRLDRPFLFAVRIRSTGSVPFIAAIQDPSAQ